MLLYVKDKFDAAHFLPDHKGKCKNLHGHTWIVEVWIKQQLEQEESMIIDFGDVKNIITKFDHNLINDYLTNPTAENILRHFLTTFHSLHLATTIRIWETESTYIEGDTNVDL